MTSTETATAAAATPRAGRSRKLMVSGFLREAALLPVLVVTVAVGASINEFFFTKDNIVNVLQQSGVLAMLVLAEALIVIAGKFDLSMESTFGVAAMTGAWLVMPVSAGGSGWGWSPVWGFVAAMTVGVIVGAVNAAFIVKLRLNAFVVTLGMLILLRGITVGMSNGQTINGVPEVFTYIGAARPLGMPLVVWIVAGMYLVFGLFMRNHRIGRAIYAIGGNPNAARTAGINVDRITAGLFILAGLIAAFAGVSEVGRFGGVPANHGKDLIFTVMAATVIGGISLKGGRGTLFGALTGVLLLGVIRNLLVLEQVKAAWIDAVYGAIILIALAVSRLASGEQE